MGRYLTSIGEKGVQKHKEERYVKLIYEYVLWIKYKDIKILEQIICAGIKFRRNEENLYV